MMAKKRKEGYIKIERTLQHHWLWEDKPFSKGQAWIDLILMANHEDKKFPYKNTVIEGKRGTVYRSKTYLANRWGWDRKKVTQFLKQLQNDEMVALTTTTHGTTVSLINYDKFQDSGSTKEQPKAQTMDNRWTTAPHIQDIIEDTIEDTIKEEYINSPYQEGEIIYDDPPWEPEGGWDG
jgi:DNA replication protein DnaD